MIAIYYLIQHHQNHTTTLRLNRRTEKKQNTRNQINKFTKTKQWLAGIPQLQLWSSDNKSNGAKILT